MMMTATTKDPIITIPSIITKPTTVIITLLILAIMIIKIMM